MTVTTSAHVNFRGQARDALGFYQSVFGGELSLATYADVHSVESPEQAGHIAFGRVKAANGFDIMAYDVCGRCRFSGCPDCWPQPICRRGGTFGRLDRSQLCQPTLPRSTSNSPATELPQARFPPVTGISSARARSRGPSGKSWKVVTAPAKRRLFRR
jgi:hypothetical protein